jgi:hypothetical protein
MRMEWLQPPPHLTRPSTTRAARVLSNHHHNYSNHQSSEREPAHQAWLGPVGKSLHLAQQRQQQLSLLHTCSLHPAPTHPAPQLSQHSSKPAASVQEAGSRSPCYTASLLWKGQPATAAPAAAAAAGVRWTAHRT